jgi:hypothetical protein
VFVPGGLVGSVGPLRERLSTWADESDKLPDALEPELTTPSP